MPGLHCCAAPSICATIPHTDLVSDREKSGGDVQGQPEDIYVRGGQPERNFECLCLISACVSFWKLVFTSATRPTAGTRRCPSTSTVHATTSTSSTSRRPCLCCTRL